MKENKVNIPCADITVEAWWLVPGVTGPYPAVVVCHPHPLQGGSMENNVVAAVYRELAKNHIAVLRFNFRGVGNSSGTYDDGAGEQSDLKATVDFVLQQPLIDSSKIGVAGYSFGGGVSIPVACTDSRVKALALVSPMMSPDAWDLLAKCTIPKLLVAGGEDTFFPAADYKANFKNVAEPKQLAIVPGADHFWHAFEDEMAEKVAGFFKNNFI